MTEQSRNAVAIAAGAAVYPGAAPFHPDTAYPELQRLDLPIAASSNSAYALVRDALRFLAGAAGEANPLAQVVRPGDTVVLKPNLIRESHLLEPDQWEQVITHGAVVRAVLDYVALALDGTGRIIIADGPQTDSDFDEIVRRAGLREVVAFWQGRGLDVTLLDLRRDRWYQRGEITYRREQLPGDPAGYTTVELGHDSEFAAYGLSGHFYGADYDTAETATFHNRDRHAYVLCRTVMDADVVINLPKLKTHKKTGVTLSLKNMVGINGYRNCLPHHTIGTPAQDGDEFPTSSIGRRVESGSIALFKRTLAGLGRGGAWARAVKRAGRAVFGDTHTVVRSGNWHGNDTAWRMVLDLNKCLFHFDGTAARRARPLRYLSVVDGILAGEGNGPQAPDVVQAGLVVAGRSPLAVDTVCATLMGFDYRRIPVLANGWAIACLPLDVSGPDAVECRSNRPEWTGSLSDLEAAPVVPFEPHFGWKGHIERVVTPPTAE